MADLNRIRAAFPDLDKYEYSDSEVVQWLAGRTGEDPQQLAVEFGLIDPNQGDFSRGIDAGWSSTKALGSGVIGIAGDALQIDSLRNAGIRGYQRNMADVGLNARSTDSAEGVNSVGDAVDFAQYWGGYALPQVAEALVTAGVGSQIAKQGLKYGVRRQVGQQVANRFAGTSAGRDLLKTTGQRGAYTALGAQAVGTETGAVYGDAAQRAIDSGEGIDNLNLGRIGTAGLAAGALEFGADVATLGLARLGPGKAAFDMLNTGSRTANAAIRGGTGALAEGLTEVAQTGIEDIGAGTSFADANFSDPTSFFAGVVGGGGMGTFGGAISRPNRGLSSTPEDTGSVVEPSQEGTQSAIDQELQAQQQAEQERLRAREQEAARIDAAPTFVSPKDFDNLSEEERRLELYDPQSELGAQFREWRIDNKKRAVDEKELKKIQDEFLKFTRDDDRVTEQKYETALDDHIAYRADAAQRSPEVAARVAEMKQGLVAELQAEIKAKNPEGIRLVEQKAKGLLLPAEWREAKLIALGKIKLKGAKDAGSTVASTAAATTAPTEVTPETTTPEAPPMPAAEDVPVAEAAPQTPVVEEQPVVTPKPEKGRRAEMRAYAEEVLGPEWETYEGLSQEFSEGKGFYSKRKGKWAFQDAVDQAAQAAREEEARKNAPETPTAPPAANDAQVTQVRQDAIAYANEKLGNEWLQNYPELTTMLSEQQFAPFQQRVNELADQQEAAPTQEAAPVEQPVVEQQAEEAAPTQQEAKAKITSLADLFKGDLPADVKLSGQEQKVFDVLQQAFRNNEIDSVLQSNGSWNSKDIAQKAGVGEKTTNTLIKRVAGKVAKANGYTMDEVRDLAKRARNVEEAAGVNDTNAVFDEAALGEDGGFNTTASVGQGNYTVTNAKGQEEQAQPEDIAYTEARSQEPDAFEAKRAREAAQVRQEFEEELKKHPAYKPAQKAWDNNYESTIENKSDRIPFSELDLASRYEWFERHLEFQSGDFPAEQLNEYYAEIRAKFIEERDNAQTNTTNEGAAAESQAAPQEPTGTQSEVRSEGATTQEEQPVEGDGQQVTSYNGETGQTTTATKAPVVQTKKKRRVVKPPKVEEVADEAKRQGTEEEFFDAEAVAEGIGGQVVWQRGAVALVRTNHPDTGKVFYIGARGTQFTQRDIDDYGGKGFTEKELADLRKAKADLVAEDNKQHQEAPFINFESGPVQFSNGVPEEFKGVLAEWRDMLGIDANIYITTLEDAKNDRFSYTGPHRKIAAGVLDPDARGMTAKMDDGAHFLIFDNAASKAHSLEIMAHELGHIHQKEVFDNAPQEMKDDIFEAHREWLKTLKGANARQLVDTMRARKVGKTTPVNEAVSASEAGPYWKSFSEWYADQVSRWATTQKQPLTAVEKFFSRLGKAMKSFYDKLVNAKYLPDGDFLNFLEEIKRYNSKTRMGQQPQSEGDIQQMAGRLDATTRGREATNKFAEWARERGGDAAAQTVVNFQSLAKFGTDSLKFLHQYVRDSGSKAANAMYRAIKEADKTRQDIRRQVESIGARARDLTPERLAKVNDFLGKSTFEQKWGYDPQWQHRQVKVDPVMRVAFNNLKPEEQRLVRDVFQHGENMRLRKQEIAKALGVPGRFFTDASLEGPYAPLKRFGNQVAVLYSTEYEAAKAAVDANATAANKKRLEDLKSNPDHYIVQFFDTPGAADRFVTEHKRRGWKGDYSKKTGDIFQDRVTNTEVFERVMAAVKASDIDGEASKAFSDMIRTMYFQSLDERDARLSGSRRKYRAGYEKNMIRSFMSHARAEAGLIATMENGAQINEAFAQLGKEADADRPRLKPVYDMMSRHYRDSLAYSDTWFSRVQDKITTFNSVWMLTTSLGYHITNATQPAMVTVPRLAGDFKNYNGAWGALIRGYKVGLASTKMTKSMQTEIDISKTPPKYHEMLKELQLRNLLDVGMEEDLSQFDRFNTGYEFIDNASDLFGKIVHKLYQVARYVEAQNRISTAIAAYDLASANPEVARRQGMTPTEYATSVVEDTQGNFSRMDAPLLLKALPKVTTQYRKYQLMMGWAYANAFDAAFIDKSISPEEKAMGRRTLAFMVGHAGMFAGAAGIPLASTIAPYILPSDGDEPQDLERWIRQRFDGPIADVMSRGIFSLAGIDMSTKLSQGKIFDPFPYVDYEITEDGTKDLFFNAFAGPAGTTLINFARSAEYFGQGDVLKGMEYALPKGMRTAIESYRLATEGYSFRNGDVVLDPRDTNAWSLLVNAIGLPSSQINQLKWTRGQQYELTQWFGNESGRIRREYVDAYRNRDRQAMADLRDEWRELQASKDRVRPFFNGSNRVLRKQPLSDLIRSPREQATRQSRSREQLGTE